MSFKPLILLRLCDAVCARFEFKTDCKSPVFGLRVFESHRPGRQRTRRALREGVTSSATKRVFYLGASKCHWHLRVWLEPRDQFCLVAKHPEVAAPADSAPEGRCERGSHLPPQSGFFIWGASKCQWHLRVCRHDTPLF